MVDVLNPNKGKSGDTYVPPPPTEVNIRTMESDIKSMALSGGGTPQSKRVMIGGVPKGKAYDGIGKKLFKFLIWILAVGVLFGAGYYFVKPLLESNNGSTNQNGGENSSSNLPKVPPSLEVYNFQHQSVFSSEGIVSKEIFLDYPARRDNFESYQRQIEGILNSNSTSTFLEIIPRMGGGKMMAVSQFFDALGADFFDSDFLALNFEPDFTFFVYRNKNNFWPGLVLTPNPERSRLVLKSEVAVIERADFIRDFFGADPGVRADSFRDILVVGQPVRVLDFSNQNSKFLYGWFNDHLFIGTSEEGLRAALNNF